MKTSILWFRNDLRLSDNSAWQNACEFGKRILPVYILNEDKPWSLGGASRWWLHHALEDLDSQLSKVGLKLNCFRGNPDQIIEKLIDENDIEAVYWNRRYDPAGIQIDSEVKSKLTEKGLTVKSSNSSLLFEPWKISTQQGKPYKVYTPFRKAIGNFPIPEPVDFSVSSKLEAVNCKNSLPIEDLNLLPDKNWDSGFYEFWKPKRVDGLKRIDNFINKSISEYEEERDIPSHDGTSKLSPYLHFGQIGPREIVEKIKEDKERKGFKVFYQEILWREFAYHVLYHFPNTPEKPLQAKYQKFPWHNNDENLHRWKKGKTGYPIVDAGMRQLWKTGWMHNRVRMIVGSFLVKHLLISWVEGAEWFWDCLVDADLASNTLGWQWAGGCGADAAPYFRIFNPIVQGERFDPNGNYVREYVPELKKLPNKFIHKPWELEAKSLEACGVVLGEDYPEPIVDHKEARKKALDALSSIK